MSKYDPGKQRKRRPMGETKEPKKTFLIYCEGQTEEEYFKYLKTYKRISNINIKLIDLKENGNALTLAKEAVSRNNIQRKEYDEYWIIFDKDDTKDSEFEDAIKLCEENQIQVAYSIQAFEIWILLHFQKWDEKCERPELIEKINKNLENLKYGKTKEELKKVYEIIFPQIKNAIENAKYGFHKFEKKGTPISKRESSSTVFKIIENILNS